MNIRFGDYGVRSDDVCFIVYKVTVVTGENNRGRKAKAESIGQEREKALGYFGKLSQALEGLLNKHMSAADKEGADTLSLQILMDRLKEVEAFIHTIKNPTPAPSEEKEDEADLQQ